MRIAYAAVLVCIVQFAQPGVLPAQRRSSDTRSSFWYGFGLSPGWARVGCSICAKDRASGISAFVRMGGGVGRRVRIGAEFAAWRRREGGVTQSLTAVGAAAYWYPEGRRGLYLKGGLGLVSHHAEDQGDVIASSGIGPEMGIGYEFPVGRNWSLAPFFSYAIGSIAGEVKYNGAQVTDQATISFFQLGVSLSRP